MAVSDVKHRKHHSRKYNFDADDRAASKREFNRVTAADDFVKFLDDLGDDEFLRTYNNLTRIQRYGSLDWERIAGKIGQGEAQRLRQRAEDVRRKQVEEGNERYEARRAECMIALQKQTDQFRRNVDLTVGMLQSDFRQALAMVERHDLRCGDWLDDPVVAYAAGTGFAEETRQPAGVKLQITLSLDWSNSMWYNDIATKSIESFITLGLALDDLAQQNPGSIYTQAFIFARGEDGKTAGDVDHFGWLGVPGDPMLGRYEVMRRYMSAYPPADAGQDTWIAPLFDNIETWEREESDEGCVRLDVILTDGVLEHPVDVRKASEIQERRDGTLQTVLLNFLPESEWQDTTLPLKCVQYSADIDNVGGLLRQILGEFLSVYI